MASCEWFVHCSIQNFAPTSHQFQIVRVTSNFSTELVISKRKVLCILFGFNFQFLNLRLPWWEMRFGTQQNASRSAIPHCAGNINMASVSSVLVAWISIFWAAWARCPQKVESRKSGARVSEATLNFCFGAEWGELDLLTNYAGPNHPQLLNCSLAWPILLYRPTSTSIVCYSMRFKLQLALIFFRPFCYVCI